MTLPDPAPVLDLIEAFRRSKTMFTAVSLKIFDMLHDEAPATAADLAGRSALNADALERLLEACAGLGLLQLENGRFSNAPVADAYLRSASPHTLNGYIHYSNDALYPMWAHLVDAVREGGNRWEQTFGLSGPLFDRFYPTEESMRTYVMGMHGFGLLASPTVVRAFDLSAFRHFVDVGGASGHLAIAACEAYPELRATVLDQARVIPVAREQAEKSGARDRIDFAALDFFADDLPEADLFGLGRILHDWAPDKIDILLRKIYDRLPSGGGLLIVEKLLNDDKCGPVPAQMQSLNMLICTDGKERSLKEYRELLEGVGFSKVEGKWTGKPLDGIFARK